jgi:hypothetical protein
MNHATGGPLEDPPSLPGTVVPSALDENVLEVHTACKPVIKLTPEVVRPFYTRSIQL